VFYPRAYSPFPARTRYNRYYESDYLSQVSGGATALLLVGVAVWEWRRRGEGGWRTRAPLWLAAFLLFYVSLAGTYSRFLSSFLRFSLCPCVLLVLHGLRLADGRTAWSRTARVALGAGLLFLLALQAAMAYHFTHGEWVA
jgi:hypothetical protein